MRTICLILLVLSSLAGISQTFSKTNTGLKATVNDINIELQFFSPRIIRVLKSPEGLSLKKESLSVIKKPATTNLDIQQQGNIVTLKSESLQVELNLQTGKLVFSNKAGGSLLIEKDYGTQFTAVNDAGRKTYNVRQAFLLDKEEVIYGLGQQQNNKMNQRGQKVYLRQDNMKVCIPFFQSVKGYGVFWDNYSPLTFTDNPQETSFDAETGDCADYYFLWGGNADGVIAQMRDLTGQAPLMPLWVYGFNQSRERYKTQYELVDVVKRYRNLKVPLDGIVQDWQYWGKDSNWNAMSFDPTTYPAPKSMVDSIHQLKAHLFIVAWPGFGPLTKQYAEFKQKNMLINFDTWPPNSGTKPYDPYNPIARDIYWQYLNKGVFSFDIDAWWLDSSEPDHINQKDKDFDQPTFLGSLRSVRNAFPLQHVGGVYDHQRQTTSSKRVSILTRSAFAGQQRYGANTWSGDVRSDWQVFRRQIPAGLNFSLCGIPYWNTDIGGFFAGSFVKGGGAKNPEFQELYTRWMQFATFTPMMRSHGTDIPRDIYQFGQRGDWSFDVQEKFINLRYSLLPYTYSTAWQVTSQAGSFIRALYMDFANDKKALDIDNQYMFGKSFLVAPVTEKGAKEQAVYLPAGAIWYDFWTNETTEGGKTVNRAIPLDIMPLYVKAGSIIPWGPKVQYAEEKKWDNLELRIYSGADADFTLYEDENNSYNYEKGNFTEITFHWNNGSRTLTIDNRKGTFPGMLNNRKFNIVLVDTQNGVGTNTPVKINKTVAYKGKEVVVRL
jgi:alpha-D-xyloside xylohydrolase